jgi:hypothetical protein
MFSSRFDYELEREASRYFFEKSNQKTFGKLDRAGEKALGPE